MFHIFSTITLLLVIPLSYYAGRRLWETLIFFFPKISKKIFWAVFWLLPLVIILPRWGGNFLPAQLSDIGVMVGYYWLVAALYLVMLFLLQDILAFFLKRIFVTPQDRQYQHSVRVVAVILVVVVLIWGSWNARHPRITRYDISIPKNAASMQKLHAVMLSDIHLGELVDSKRLARIIEQVNKLNPDLVLLPGDLAEDGASHFDREVIDIFRSLQPKLGTYASLGNHEYFGGQVDDTVAKLEMSGIHVLRDSNVQIGNSLVLVGREEQRTSRTGSPQRKDLGTILQDVDRKLPIILLNHQPTDLDEVAAQGVDLQLSGHTHGGQVFPIELITSQINEQDWGYLVKGNLQLIVTCGVGVWGPPLRIGTKSEIVDIYISFAAY